MEDLLTTHDPRTIERRTVSHAVSHADPRSPS